jgi:hypothetical protein
VRITAVTARILLWLRASAENGQQKPSISSALIRHSAVAALVSGIGATFLNPTLPSAI